MAKSIWENSMGGSINQKVLDSVSLNKPFDHLMWFAEERENIYQLKAAGRPRDDWTTDPTLRKYKFCNVFRDQDRTTQWIYDWVKHLKDDELFANLVYARMCNNPDVMMRTSFVGHLSPENFVALIDRIGGGKTKSKVNKNTVWKDPYQIAGAFKGRLGLPYREHVIAYHLPKVSSQLFDTVVKHAGIKDLTPLLEDLAVVWGYRMNMVFTQAILDLAHFRPDLVSDDAFFPLGDGAKPALRLLNFETELDCVTAIRDAWNAKYDKKMKIKDAEQTLCEWRKYLAWSNDLAKKRRLYK